MASRSTAAARRSPRHRRAAAAIVLGLGLLALLAVSGHSPRALAGPLPPSWDVRNEELYPDEPPAVTNKHPSRQARRLTKRPWYEPRVALGVGLNFPELLPFEGYLFFGRYFGIRAFYTPPLPFNVRVEMPSDVISTKKDVGVANPDFTVRMKALYGAHYGVEGLLFPFGGSFFLGGGVSHRRMRVTGDAKSPILICSLIEAAKEPPCADPSARLETETELTVKAQIETSALLARAGLGWFWNVGSFGYLMFNAGVTKPTHIHRSVDIQTGLAAGDGHDEEITGALAQVKAEREADLREKTIKAMQPVDEKTLPIVGLAAGVRF